MSAGAGESLQAKKQGDVGTGTRGAVRMLGAPAAAGELRGGLEHMGQGGRSSSSTGTGTS